MEGDILRILYTGFKGKNNSSCRLLSKISGEKLFLTNSFEGLKNDIANIAGQYDLVVMFGLDTKLRDMVRMERIAEYDGVAITTKIDCEAICKHMEENDIRCVVSEMPTKYLCNAAYYHMLHKTVENAVLIHIPSSKNMSEYMMEKIVKSMKEIENV